MADPSTTNYGWVKPTVGSDADTWGGLINADLDAIDATVGVHGVSLSTVASIIAIAGGELINLSGSVAGVSSSLGGVSSSAANASSSQVAISSSLASTTAATTALSASTVAVSSSLGAVQASLAGVSGSLSATASLGVAVSSSVATLGGVSSSLAGVASALGSAVSGVGASAIGYLGIPLANKSGAYTPVLADAGKHFFFTASATATIPANASVAYSAGTFLKFSADVGVSLSVVIASDTLRYPSGGGTGSRAVTGPGFIVVEKQKSGEWWVVGGVNVS